MTLLYGNSCLCEQSAIPLVLADLVLMRSFDCSLRCDAAIHYVSNSPLSFSLLLRAPISGAREDGKFTHLAYRALPDRLSGKVRQSRMPSNIHP